MIYLFHFEWGECWTVTEEDFTWDVEYWCKVVARHIYFYRVNIAKVKPDNLMNTVELSRGGEYFGLVSVSDNYVHVILDGEGKYCWRIEEL